MKALLWKDWKLAQPVLIAAATLYCVPTAAYFIMLVLLGGTLPVTYPERLMGGATLVTMGQTMALLAVPAFGAVMFAKERRERTVEFTACLPVNRRRVVLSKAIIASGLLLLMWCVTALLMGTVALLARTHDQDVFETLGLKHQWPSIFQIPAGSVMGMCLGWMFSTIVRSEVRAAAMAFVISLTVVIMLPVAAARLRLGTDPLTTFIVSMVPMGLAVFAGAIGTWVALRKNTL